MSNSSSVGNLWAPYEPGAYSDTKSSRMPNSDLDKDAFLRLLVAQMQYQDPLNPMENKEFLAQMAQFTALEQMQNMNKTTSQTQAYGMIGKNVYAYYPNAAGVYEEVEGLVTAVSTKSGEAYLLVNGKDVPLSAVSMVGDDYFMSAQLNSIFESVSTSRDMDLIGKYIQAITVENGQATGFVEGVVDYVRFMGSQAILMVDGKEVFTSEVASVSKTPLLLGKTINARMINENGEYYNIENGIVSDVIINKNKAYLVVDGENVPIEKINYAIEALRYVGKSIEYPGHSGVVLGVTIRLGIPYLNVNDKQLSFVEFKKLD